MSFINRTYLWALLLALVPIIIYYLMRFRSLKVSWGANYVLERALERLRKKLYLDQIILLALRVLACVAIVLAFARPTSNVKSARVTSSGVHRILIVDGSASMHAGEKGESQWEQVQEAMADLTASWGRGERWSLYFASSEPEWVVRDAVVSTPEETRSTLERLDPTESRADMVRAVEQVLDVIPEDEQVELYIFGDDQAISWSEPEVLPVVPENVDVYWLSPKLPSRQNLAVVQLTTGRQRALAGHPCAVFARVRNFGTEPAENVELELLVDGAFSGRQRASLQPGQETQVAFDLSLDAAGSHAVTVRTPRDMLRTDNEMSAGLEVAEKLRVLVLRDADKKEKFDSAWGFLQLAAQVMGRRNEDDQPLFARALMEPALFEGEDAALPARLREGPDVVVLDAGRTVTPALVQALRDYVNGGGGLVLSADDRVKAQHWNDLLGGAGLLPAPLVRPRIEPLGGERYQTVTRSGFDSAAMRVFSKADRGDLTRLRFYAWYELDDPIEGAARMVAFADGRPFAVELRRPLGCVVLLASGLNGRTNNLIVSELFYPLTLRLLGRAADGTQYPRTLPRGEAIRVRVPRPDSVQGMTWALADTEAVPIMPRAEGDYAVGVVPEGAARSGLGSMLIVRRGGARRVWIGIQGERMDSDLAAMSASQRGALLRRLDAVEVSSWEELDEALRARRRGSEWHTWLIVALLALLVGEMLMERRFV